jgi:hypothetical protein
MKDPSKSPTLGEEETEDASSQYALLVTPHIETVSTTEHPIPVPPAARNHFILFGADVGLAVRDQKCTRPLLLLILITFARDNKYGFEIRGSIKANVKNDLKS